MMFFFCFYARPRARKRNTKIAMRSRLFTQKNEKKKKKISRIGTVDLTTAAALRKPVIHVIRDSEKEEEDEVETYSLYAWIAKSLL